MDKWEEVKQNAAKFNAWSLAHLDRFVEEKKHDPCIGFADGEEWEELQGHDWEMQEDGALRCSNCGVVERGGSMDRLLNL